MNTSTQLKALIRNLSKEKSVQAEIILRNFMLERLLERISLSPFRDKFILKGGMLVAAIVGIVPLMVASSKYCRHDIDYIVSHQHDREQIR